MTSAKLVVRESCLLALLLLSACASPLAAPSRPPSQSAVPTACAGDEVKKLLTDFIDAFNTGRDPARLFAPTAESGIDAKSRFASRFHWYSVSGGGIPNLAIYERSDLAAYFSRRLAANERIALVSLTYTPDAERYPRADVSFVVIRTASDLGSVGEQVGKAAINCRDQTILVWTI